MQNIHAISGQNVMNRWMAQRNPMRQAGAAAGATAAEATSGVNQESPSDPVMQNPNTPVNPNAAAAQGASAQQASSAQQNAAPQQQRQNFPQFSSMMQPNQMMQHPILQQNFPRIYAMLSMMAQGHANGR
jgi:hypothetical protein